MDVKHIFTLLKRVSGMRVLIAYGSRWGSTEEIAQRLAGFLGEEGVEADSRRSWGNITAWTVKPPTHKPVLF